MSECCRACDFCVETFPGVQAAGFRHKNALVERGRRGLEEGADPALAQRPDELHRPAHSRRRRRSGNPQAARPLYREPGLPRAAGCELPRAQRQARHPSHRPDRARCDAARRLGSRRLPGPAGAALQRADHPAHRAERGCRPHHRPRDRRRRLSRQAVQSARADRPRARRAAPPRRNLAAAKRGQDLSLRGLHRRSAGAARHRSATAAMSS